MSSTQGTTRQYYETIHKLTLIQNKLSDEFISNLIKISELYLPAIDFNTNNDCIVLFDVLVSQLACCLLQGTRMDQVIIITICGQLFSKLNQLSPQLQQYQGYYQQQVIQILILGLRSESIELKSSWTYMLLETLQNSPQLITQNITGIIFALLQQDNIKSYQQNNRTQMISTQKISQKEYIITDYITVIVEILDKITLTEEQMNNLFIKVFKVNKNNWENVQQFYDLIFESLEQKQVLELIRSKLAQGTYDKTFIHILSTLDPKDPQNCIDDANYLSCLLLCLKYLNQDTQNDFEKIVSENEEILQKACEEVEFANQIDQILDKTDSGLLIIKCKSLFDILGQNLLNTIFGKMVGEYIEYRWFGVSVPSGGAQWGTGNESYDGPHGGTRQKPLRSKLYLNSVKFVKGLKELEPDSYLEYFLEKLNDHFELDEIKIYYSTFKMIFEEFGIQFFEDQFIFISLQQTIQEEQIEEQNVISGKVLFLLAFREYLGDQINQAQFEDIKQIMYKLLVPQEKLNIFVSIQNLYDNISNYKIDVQNLTILINIAHEILAIADKEMKAAEVDKLLPELRKYYEDIGVTLLDEAQNQNQDYVIENSRIQNIIDSLELRFKSPANFMTSTFACNLYTENTYLVSFILIKLGVQNCIYTNLSIQQILKSLLSFNYEEQTSATIHLAVFCLQEGACELIQKMLQQDRVFARNIALQLSTCLPLISTIERLGTQIYSQQSNIVAAPLKALISSQSILDMIDELEHTNKYVLTNDQETSSKLNDLVQSLKRQLKLQKDNTKFLEISNQIVTLIIQELGETIIRIANVCNDQLPIEQISQQEPEISLNCIIDRQDDDLQMPTLTQITSSSTVNKYLHRTILEHAMNVLRQRLSVMKISSHSIQVIKEMFSVCQMILQGQVEYYDTLLKITTVHVNQFDNLSDYLDIVASKLSLFLVCDQDSNITDVLIDQITESLQVIISYKKEFDLDQHTILDEVVDNGILLQLCTQSAKFLIQQAYSNHVTKNFEFASLTKILSTLIQNTNQDNIILLKSFGIALDSKVFDIDVQLVKGDLFQLLLFVQLMYSDELIQLMDFNIDYIQHYGVQALYDATNNYNVQSGTNPAIQQILNLIFDNEIVIKQNLIQTIRRANATYKVSETSAQIFESGLKQGNIVIVYLLLQDMMQNIDLSYKDKIIKLYSSCQNIDPNNLVTNYVYLHFLEQIGLVSDKLFNLILRQQTQIVITLFTNVMQGVINASLNDQVQINVNSRLQKYEIGSKQLQPSHIEYYISNFINVIDQIVSVQKNTFIIQELIKVLVKIVIQNINVEKLQVQVITALDNVNQLLLSLLKHQNLQLTVDDIQLQYVKELVKILFRKSTNIIIRQELIYLLSMLEDNQGQILTKYIKVYLSKLFIMKDEDTVNKVIKSTQKALEVHKLSSQFIKLYGVYIIEIQEKLSQIYCEIDNTLYKVFYKQFLEASQQYLKHEYYENIFAAYYEAKLDAITINNIQVAIMPQLCLYYVYRQVLYNPWFENVIETIEIDGNSSNWWKQIMELKTGNDIIERLE